MRSKGEGSVVQRADGRWQASIRYKDDSGKSQRSYAYAKTEVQAKKLLRDMQRRVEDGHNAVDSNALVSVIVEKWISGTLEASARKPSTKETYASLLRTHVIPQMGDVKLKSLSVAQVRELILGVSSTRSMSTSRQTHIVLKMVLDDAVKDGILKTNPIERVDRPKTRKHEASHFTSSQVATLRHAAQGHRLEPLLTVLAFTGVRRGEALALRWDDVDLASTSPSIRVIGTLGRLKTGLVEGAPKSTAGRRTVPLVEDAVLALQQVKSNQRIERLAAGIAWTESGYVFTTQVGTPVDPRNALRWFTRLSQRAAQDLMKADNECDHAGLKVTNDTVCPACARKPGDYLSGSIHTLRHSTASVLLGKGMPMPMVKNVLGHSSISVTVDMYGHMEPSLIAAEMRTGMVGYGSA
jgi:integrase